MGRNLDWRSVRLHHGYDGFDTNGGNSVQQALTTAQRNIIDPAELRAGDRIWNLTTSTLQAWTGVAWADVGSGGVADTFTHAGTTPYDVGGIPAGSGPYVLATIQDLFEELLYPYVPPTFSAFALDLTTVEVGYTITGNHTFSWTTTTPANITPMTLDLNDVSTPTVLETNIAVASPKVHDFTGVPIVHTVQYDQLFRVSADDTSPATFTRDCYVYWSWKVYAGTGDAGPLDEAEIEALSDYSALTRGYARTYSFSGGATYKYLCYPTVMDVPTPPTSFKDASTGFNVPMEVVYTVNITNAQGVAADYNVYRTTNILNDPIDIEVS